VGGVANGQRARQATLCERFDPGAGTWEAMPPLPVPCTTCSAVAHRGLLYVVGMQRIALGGPVTVVCQHFDPATHAWAPFRAPSAEASPYALVAMPDRLYIVGTLGVNSCARMDTRRDEWESVPRVCPCIGGVHGVAAVAERIYVVGCRGPGYHEELRILNTRVGVWDSPPSQWLPRSFRGGYATGIVAAAGKVYIFGVWGTSDRAPKPRQLPPPCPDKGLKPNTNPCGDAAFSGAVVLDPNIGGAGRCTQWTQWTLPLPYAVLRRDYVVVAV